MKRVALYTRVSTSSQEKEESIKTQFAKLRKIYGKNILKEYNDTCSGVYLNREGLRQLRRDAKKGLFNTVALYSLDRLSRKLSHQTIIIEELESYGVSVEILGEELKDTAEGKLNWQLRGAIAEYEREKIKQRTIDGKMRKIDDGIVPGTSAPFGYTYFKKGEDCGEKGCKQNGEYHFHINPPEAKIVQRIFNTYLEEQSLWGTAKRFREEGLKFSTRMKKEPHYFSKQTIDVILKNESYIGLYHYGKTSPCQAKYHLKKDRKHKKTGRQKNPKSEWKSIKIPAIIDRPLFKRVQEIKAERKKRYLRKTKYQYLCQGLIKCVRCGRTYLGRKMGKSLVEKRPNGCAFIYSCPQKYGTNLDEKHCHARQIFTDKLDKMVWSYIQSLISNPQKVKNAIRALKEKREGERDINQKACDNLKIQRNLLEKKASKILDLYSEDSISKAVLDSKMEEIKDQKILINKQIEEIESLLQKIETRDTMEKEIEKLCLQYQNTTEEPSFELKKRIIRRWVKEIRLPDEGGVIIKVRIPEPKEPIKLSLNNPVYHRQFISEGIDDNKTLSLPYCLEFEEAIK